jgi:hypothetical protein
MNDLRLWGERGLVSSFFLDLERDQTLGRWKTFLRTLDPPIDASGLSHVWAIVEPDFGNKGFGHPDFVARLEFTDERVLVLLLEAKMATYKKASWPNSRRSKRGFNSRINGQIELNHRLALALSNFDPDLHDKLEEPEWIVNSIYTTAVAGHPRVVKKPAVLEELASPLASVPFERYLHVIITSDRVAPWYDLRDCQWPLILKDDVREAPEQFRKRLFWVSWKRLYEGLKPPLSGDSFEKNYMFQSTVLERAGAVPQDLTLPPGVYLVKLKGDFYQPNTCVHLSWDGKAFRLRDYSGAKPVEIRITVDTASLLTDVIERQSSAFDRRSRERWQNYQWWKDRIEEQNREWGLG